MEAWQKQMKAEAEEQKRKLEKLRRERGTTEPGIVSERMEILTDADVKQREAALRQGKTPLSGAQRRHEDYEVDPEQSHMEKIQKYV